MRRIGITIGDPCGIGPELVAGLLTKHEELDAHLHIYGSNALFEDMFTRYGLNERDSTQLVFHSCAEPKKGFYRIEDGMERAGLVLKTIERSTADALDGNIDALLTAPIDKKVVQTLHPDFSGHTGYLATLADNARTTMVLDNQEFRVALLTEHIPLREVTANITKERILGTLETCRSGLASYLGLKDPSIVIAGVNPHAGEIGHCPEDDLIKEVVGDLKENGWNIEGPRSSDSLFSLGRGYTWDLILSPYHDQGLVAAKYPGLNRVVNITLGLPFLRVSPGHGVAYDKVGTNYVDHRSFRRAFSMAMKGRIL